MTKKLTLSADEKVIREAKRLAARQGTSVSGLFARLVRSMARGDEDGPDVPPDSIAGRASGYITLPKGKTPREVLTQALIEKHGSKR